MFQTLPEDAMLNIKENVKVSKFETPPALVLRVSTGREIKKNSESKMLTEMDREILHCGSSLQKVYDIAKAFLQEKGLEIGTDAFEQPMKLHARMDGQCLESVNHSKQSLETQSLMNVSAPSSALVALVDDRSITKALDDCALQFHVKNPVNTKKCKSKNAKAIRVHQEKQSNRAPLPDEIMCVLLDVVVVTDKVATAGAKRKAAGDGVVRTKKKSQIIPSELVVSVGQAVIKTSEGEFEVEGCPSVFTCSVPVCLDEEQEPTCIDEFRIIVLEEMLNVAATLAKSIGETSAIYFRPTNMKAVHMGKAITTSVQLRAVAKNLDREWLMEGETTKAKMLISFGKTHDSTKAITHAYVERLR
jgi:hypothetical protein